MKEKKTFTFSTLLLGAKRIQNTTINDHQRYCQSEQNVLSEVFFSSRWFCDEKCRCNDDESKGGFVVVLHVRKAKTSSPSSARAAMHGTTVFGDDDAREKEDVLLLFFREKKRDGDDA